MQMTRRQFWTAFSATIAKAAFSDFDRDGTRRINVEELQAVIKRGGFDLPALRSGVGCVARPPDARGITLRFITGLKPPKTSRANGFGTATMP